MWNRLKNLMHHFMNVVLACILLGACISYVAINSILATELINALRLDTYVGYETGFRFVMLVLLLGWGPLWLSRSVRVERRR